MKTLHELAANWLVHSLGWTLLHFCWQGAVIAAILWSALQLVDRRAARVRYAAACVALALMVLLPLATFGQIALAQHRLMLATKGTAIAIGPMLVVPAGLAGTSWLAHLQAVLDPTVPWLLLAWFAGSALFLVRLSVGFQVTRRMRLLHVSTPADELQRIFTTLQQRLRLSRPIVLMTSALVQVPTVIGWLRPVVLIPVSCFTGLPQLQIEAIICHELAHIRRHDYLVSVVQSVVEALLFYHPAVWWVSQQVRRERECCCDDLAVAAGGDALAYARALTSIAAQCSPYPQVLLGANGGVLTMRIKRLLMPQSSSAASQFAALAMLAFLAISAVAIGSTTHAKAQSASAGAASIEAPVPPTVRVSPLPAAVKPAPFVPAPPAAPAKRAVPAVPAPPAIPALASAPLPPVIPAPPAPPQPQNVPPVKIAGPVAATNILVKVQPIYPQEARTAHIEGAVVLDAIISTTGDVKALRVISGPEELRASTLEAVQQWKYKPYLVNDEPVEVKTTITVNYNIRP